MVVLRPIVLPDGRGILGGGRSEIRGESSVDVWFGLREVDIDDLAVFRVLVRLQVMSELLHVPGDALTLGGVGVVSHETVKRKHARRQANFRAHVLYRRHARAA